MNMKRIFLLVLLILGLEISSFKVLSANSPVEKSEYAVTPLKLNEMPKIN